jgi:beta-glucosidase
MKKILIFLVALVVLAEGIAQERKITSTVNNDQQMKKFIDELMSKMTQEEKVGQLNLVSVGFDVTGPIVSQNVEEKIAKGNVVCLTRLHRSL